MEAYLYLHGVPGQHEHWNEEHKWDGALDKFYKTGGQDEPRLYVEQAPTGGYFYTYIFYRNVWSAGKVNRPGSFFALTLQCSDYLSAVADLYHIFDLVVRHQVIGRILLREGNILRYAASSFDEMSEACNEVTSAFWKMFDQNFTQTSFVQLKRQSATGTEAGFNPTDATDANVQMCILSGHRVIIAPTFESQAVREAAGTKQQALDAQAKQLAAVQAQLTNTQAQLQAQASELDTLRAQVAQNEAAGQKNKALNRLADELRQSREAISSTRTYYNRINDILNRIEGKVPPPKPTETDWTEGKTTNAEAGAKKPDTNNSKAGHGDWYAAAREVRQAFPFLNFLLGIVILALLLFTPRGCQGCSGTALFGGEESPGDSVVTDAIVQSGPSESDPATGTTDSLDTSPYPTDIEGYPVTDATGDPDTTPKAEQLPRLRINIIGRSSASAGQPVKLNILPEGRRYLDKDTRAHLDGRWYVTSNNATLVEGSSPGTATLTPDAAGTVTVVYQLSNGTIIERNITVKLR